MIAHRAASIALWSALLFVAPPCVLAAQDAFVADDTRAGDSARARVSKVRIFVDGREYAWTENGIAAMESSGEAADGESIRVETVISFLIVRPGLSFARDRADELNRSCGESELALADSGLFYEATVQALPARKNPLERTVLVTVTTGFLWRFGGGNAWGMVGKDGIGGGRNSLRGYVGWNRNGMSYADYRAFGLPLALGASLFALAPGRYAGMDSVSGNPDAGRAASAGVMAGWFVRSDVLVSVDAVAGPDSFSRDAKWNWSLQPAVSWRKYLVPGDPEDYGTESDVGVDARAFFFPVDGARKAEASAFVHGRVSESLALAVKAASGTSAGNAGFDLYLTEDRSVRSGWHEADLFAREFAFASIEARRRVVSFSVPPGFACALQAFAFSDAAIAVSGANGLAVGGANDGDNGDGSGRVAVLDAYGAGLRILFDNPVFAYFSFTYGVNREGAGRFMFCGSAGF